MRVFKILLLRKSILIILFFTFFSVNNIYSQNKLEFQKHFGKNNSKMLDSLINDFEMNFLKKNYKAKSLRISYSKYLQDVINSFEKNKEPFKYQNFEILKENKIYSLVYHRLDTVFIGKSKYPTVRKNKNTIIAKHLYERENGIVDTLHSESYCCEDINETKMLVKQIKFRPKFNSQGLFLKSLEKIKNKSDFLNEYLEYIDIAGEPRQEVILSSSLLENNIDLIEYYIKTIILFNIFYQIY